MDADGALRSVRLFCVRAGASGPQIHVMEDEQRSITWSVHFRDVGRWAAVFQVERDRDILQQWAVGGVLFHEPAAAGENNVTGCVSLRQQHREPEVLLQYLWEIGHC